MACHIVLGYIQKFQILRSNMVQGATWYHRSSEVINENKQVIKTSKNINYSRERT